jgi:metallo-beta-lactamase family protein
MKIEFQGAARTVTGSMHLIHFQEKLVLLDCGLFQGKRAEANERNKTFPFDPASVSAVVLSHAHIDHSGNLPHLVRHGFKGPIYATPATRDLCAIMLADSGHIQEKDAEYLNKKLARQHASPIEPLYTAQDAVAALEQFKSIPYEKEFDVLPNCSAKYSDAGHILGSASVRITMRENGTT